MIQNYNQGQTLALSWLRSSIATLKTFAHVMGIQERALQRWRSGEARIPKRRIKEILTIARFEVAQLDRLKQETDAYLLALRDPGNFKASAKLYLESSAGIECGSAP